MNKFITTELKKSILKGLINEFEDPFTLVIKSLTKSINEKDLQEYEDLLKEGEKIISTELKHIDKFNTEFTDLLSTVLKNNKTSTITKHLILQTIGEDIKDFDHIDTFLDYSDKLKKLSKTNTLIDASIKWSDKYISNLEVRKSEILKAVKELEKTYSKVVSIFIDNEDKFTDTIDRLANGENINEFLDDITLLSISTLLSNVSDVLKEEVKKRNLK